MMRLILILAIFHGTVGRTTSIEPAALHRNLFTSQGQGQRILPPGAPDPLHHKSSSTGSNGGRSGGDDSNSGSDRETDTDPADYDTSASDENDGSARDESASDEESFVSFYEYNLTNDLGGTTDASSAALAVPLALIALAVAVAGAALVAAKSRQQGMVRARTNNM